MELRGCHSGVPAGYWYASRRDAFGDPRLLEIAVAVDAPESLLPVLDPRFASRHVRQLMALTLARYRAAWFVLLRSLSAGHVADEEAPAGLATSADPAGYELQHGRPAPLVELVTLLVAAPMAPPRLLALPTREASAA